MTSCRYCGAEGAYDSGVSVECSNPACEYFTLDQCKNFLQSEIKKFLVDSLSSSLTTEQLNQAHKEMSDLVSSVGQLELLTPTDIKIKIGDEALYISL